MHEKSIMASQLKASSGAPHRTAFLERPENLTCDFFPHLSNARVRHSPRCFGSA